MYSIDFSNIEIQKTLISGLFAMFNTVIGATAAGLIGKTFANRRKLQENLKIAISDIEFLLEIERIHCDNNKQKLGEPRKILVRKLARSSGFSFSGKYTPGRIRSVKFPT